MEFVRLKKWEFMKGGRGACTFVKHLFKKKRKNKSVPSLAF